MNDEYFEEEEPRQIPWYLVTGIVLGLLVGLLVSLVISPIKYIDTAPAMLAEPSKDQYRLLISLAFQAGSNFSRAESRMALLEDANPPEALAAHAQRVMADSQDLNAARALAAMAAALANPAYLDPTPLPAAQGTPEVQSTSAQAFATLDLAQAVQTATPQPTPTVLEPTRTPIPTFTPRATRTTLPTLGVPFVLRDRQEICDPASAGQLQLELHDNNGNPVAGVQITVNWAGGGQDQFYTGLYSSISAGYADFEMTPEVTYSIRIGNTSEAIEDIAAPACQGADGNSYWGGLRLELFQP